MLITEDNIMNNEELDGLKSILIPPLAEGLANVENVDDYYRAMGDFHNEHARLAMHESDRHYDMGDFRMSAKWMEIKQIHDSCARMWYNECH